MLIELKNMVRNGIGVDLELCCSDGTVPWFSSLLSTGINLYNTLKLFSLFSSTTYSIKLTLNVYFSQSFPSFSNG